MAHKITTDKVKDLIEDLNKISSDWRLFAGQLGVDDSKLLMIQDNNAGKPNSVLLCFSDALRCWVQSSDNPTYEDVAKVLRGNTVTNLPLAKEIEEKYLQKLPEKATKLSHDVADQPRQTSDAQIRCNSEAQEMRPQPEQQQPLQIEHQGMRQEVASLHGHPAPSQEVLLPQPLPSGAATRTEAAALSTPEAEDLQAQLNLAVRNIQNKFAQLLSNTRELLKAKGVTPVQLAACVLDLAHISSDKRTKTAVLSDKADDLLQATSIDAIFAIISGYSFWSFFNYDLLKHVITNCGVDQKGLDEYNKDFEEFCRRKITELPPAALKLGNGNGVKKEKILFIINISHPTLQSICNVKERIAQILNVPTSALQVNDVVPSCVVVEFLVPQCISQQLFPLTEEQKHSLYHQVQVLTVCWRGTEDNLEAQFAHGSLQTTTSKAAPLLRDAVIELRGVDPHDLGIQLKLDPGMLDDIERDKAGCEGRRSAVVDTWLRTDRAASWEKLIMALERVGGHDVLVERLKEKYETEESNPTPPEATSALVVSNHPGVVKFTNEMSTKFSSLVHDVFLNFKRREVALDEIVIYTSTFCVAGNEHPYQLFSQQFVHQLTQAASLVEVFGLLGGYWDFHNYHLLEFLVEKLGDYTAKKLVTGYKEEFAVFQRNVKLLEFVAALPECAVRKDKMDSDKMVVKLPQSWPEASLECVEEFQRRFSDAFGIPLHVVRFDIGEESSVTLTWLIPPSLSPIIRTSPLQMASELEIISSISLGIPQRSSLLPEPTTTEPPTRTGAVGVTAEISEIQAAELVEDADPPPNPNPTFCQKFYNFFTCKHNRPSKKRSAPKFLEERPLSVSPAPKFLEERPLSVSSASVHSQGPPASPRYVSVQLLPPNTYNTPLHLELSEL